MTIPPHAPRAAPGAVIRNAMTIDVEDYFQVSAFAPLHRPRQLARARMPGRSEHRAHPRHARRRRRQGHLLHPGLDRRTLSGRWSGASSPAAMNWPATATATCAPPTRRRAEFADDISAQQGAAGRHRRPGRCSATARRAFRSAPPTCGRSTRCKQAGYRYSSSIYPIQHDHYGMPDAPRFAFYPNGPDGLLEVPITTVRLMGRNLPAGGGGYFRLLPYALSRWMMQRGERRTTASRRFSISIRGKSIPASRAPTASTPRAASATTSTSTAWKGASRR